MKIQKLQLENFRGFKGKHEIEFKPDVNVFVGINGAGKTTILDAISFFFKRFISKLTIEDKLLIQNEDINVYNNEGNFAFLGISLESNNEIREHTIFYEHSNIRSNILSSNKILYVNGINNVPIFAYYNGNIELHNSHIKFQDSKYEAFKNAFNINFNNFNNFFEWYNREENVENEERLNNNDHFRNPKLEIIRKSIINFSNFFKEFNFEKFRIQRVGLNIPQFVLEKSDEKLFFDMLSNGEKAFFYYVADIARRLAIANPNNPNADKEGDGIVLIDEIDSHLHPSWQRQIIPALTKTFPNIQFFITSHSPQVLSSIDKDYVFKIKDFQITKLDAYIRGRDSNSILYDVFDVAKHEESYKQDIEDLYSFIEKNDKINAKKKLDELTQLWGDTDREIVRANMYYEDLID
ncbi:MAG: AAA family ATPase [Bacteroidales bacterium]|nr:AAA family ATPase [Bacteroidales bacterium]